MPPTLLAPDLVDRMRLIHERVTTLLTRLTALRSELWPVREPVWGDIQSIFQSLATSWASLEADMEGVALFAGWRPDGVTIQGIAHASWHSAVASMASLFYQLLNVRWGPTTDVEGTNWCHAASVNWLSETLDLPHTKQCRLGARTRAVAWELAVEDSLSDNTYFQNIVAPHNITVCGWASLRELDVRTLETNLTAELDFTTRQAQLASRPRAEEDSVPEAFRSAWDLIKTLALKGKERRALELLCSGNGRRKFADIALDAVMEFHVRSGRNEPPPGEDQLWSDNSRAWNSLRYKLDKKLKKHGWRVNTLDREVHLKPV